MSLELYAGFVLAVVVLVLIPGPNVAVIAANSIAHGSRFGLVTVAGTSTAMLLQLVVAVAGMTTLLSLFARGFEVLRWVGVAYLLWLGLKAWRAPAADLTRTRPQRRSAARAYGRGFLVSLTNPKTLLFYGAFLPQFVSPEASPTGQLVVLAATFLVVAAALDSGWALVAARARSVLALRGRLRNRITGGLLMGAGLGLALARRR